MTETATASRGWALVIAFVMVVLGLAGGAAWMHHRDGSVSSAPVGFAAAPEMKARQSTTAVPPAPQSLAASAPAPAATAPVAPEPVIIPPRFDIVRVEPSGDTVVAGKGEPNAKVALLSEGVVVAEAKADSNGHFVVLPPALPPGDHALSLQQTPVAGAPSASAQSVTVSVPARGKGSVVVALAEPGQATKVLSAPQPPAPSQAVASAPPPAATPTAPQAQPDAKVALRAVDLEHGDGFHASGVAAPGTPLHVYLNNSHIADVVASADGAWTVTIRKGLASGHYVVRADAGQKGGPVFSRAEVPFDVPVAMAANATPAALPASPDNASVSASVTPPDARRQVVADTPGDRASDGNAVIDEIQTARVVQGDNLWNISLIRLGQATRYTQIYAANEKQIRDPNLIYPGQVFVLPR